VAPTRPPQRAPTRNVMNRRIRHLRWLWIIAHILAATNRTEWTSEDQKAARRARRRGLRRDSGSSTDFCWGQRKGLHPIPWSGLSERSESISAAQARRVGSPHGYLDQHAQDLRPRMRFPGTSPDCRSVKKHGGGPPDDQERKIHGAVPTAGPMHGPISRHPALSAWCIPGGGTRSNPRDAGLGRPPGSFRDVPSL